GRVRRALRHGLALLEACSWWDGQRPPSAREQRYQLVLDRTTGSDRRLRRYGCKSVAVVHEAVGRERGSARSSLAVLGWCQHVADQTASPSVGPVKDLRLEASTMPDRWPPVTGSGCARAARPRCFGCLPSRSAWRWGGSEG